ncbi:cupredoxin domain-containing protein [Bdellovibrionota bacterium FG-1]
MESIGDIKTKILFLIGIFITALAISAAMPGAEAGVVMAKPEKVEKAGPGEVYPESRFGRAPSSVDMGVSKGYAGRAVEEMESGNDDGAGPRGGGRSPAGLEYDGQISGPTSTPAQAPQPPAVEPSSVMTRKGVQEVAVIASDLGFFPKNIFVSRDVPVRMYVTGSSKNTLCIMMDSFQVRKQVRSQRIEEVTFTPNVPGKYRFYCPVNGMEGSLIVKEFAGPQDSVLSNSAAPARED